MRKLLLILVMIVASQLLCFSQQKTLNYTGKMDGKTVNLDSIYVYDPHVGRVKTLYPDMNGLFPVQSSNPKGSQDDILSQGFIQLQAYPNPFVDQVTIRLLNTTEGRVSIETTDLSGRLVGRYSEDMKAGHYEFSFRPGARGVYVMTVNLNGEKKELKLINSGYGSENVSISKISFMESDEHSHLQESHESEAKELNSRSKYVAFYEEQIKGLEAESGITSLVFDFDEQPASLEESLENSDASGSRMTSSTGEEPISIDRGNSNYTTLTGDFNGDGKTDLATLRAATDDGKWGAWIAMELSTGSGFISQTWNAQTPVHIKNGGGNYLDYKVVAGDFNGDGKTDIATISATGGGAWSDWVAIELSTGSGFISQNWSTTTPQHMRNGGGEQSDFEVLTGDFNGDGKTDIATISATAGGGWADWYSIDLSTGNGFQQYAWTSVTPIHMRNGGARMAGYKVLSGDFNGDGKTDIATVSADAGGGWREWYSVDLSTGYGFNNQVWYSATPSHMRNGGGGMPAYTVIAGDYNGDGKTDIATISATAGGSWADWYAVDLSSGSGFNSTVWNSQTPRHMRNVGLKSYDYKTREGDFNGDGKSDLITVSVEGGGGWADWYSMDLSLGSGFSSPVWNSGTPRHMINGGESLPYYQVLVGDYNNDGKSDLATTTAFAQGGWSDWMSMDLSYGSGFSNYVWTANTPGLMRNAGAEKTGLSFTLYHTELAALQAASGLYWQNSINEKLEYGGVIYKLEGTNLYGFTVHKGETHEINISKSYLPADATVTAAWHTHPNKYSRGPSPADFINALEFYENGGNVYTIHYNYNKKQTPSIWGYGRSGGNDVRISDKSIAWYQDKSSLQALPLFLDGATNKTFLLTLNDITTVEWSKVSFGPASIKFKKDNTQTFGFGPIRVSTTGKVGVSVSGGILIKAGGGVQVDIPAALKGRWREVVNLKGNVGGGATLEVMGFGFGVSRGADVTINFKEEGPENDWGDVVIGLSN